MPQNPKIAVTFFLPSLECGGTERNTINLINALPKEEYALSVLLAEKKGDFVKDVPAHVSLVSLEAPGLWSIFFLLAAYFKSRQADVFVCAFPRFNAVALLAKMVSGGKTKLVITEHLSFSLLSKNAKTASHRFIARFLFPYFIAWFYPKADAIICVSKGIADEIGALTGRGAHISVIYNPVAEDKIGQLAQESVDHPWFADASVPVIVMVARLSKTKDQPTLFRALDIIAKKQPIRLALVGDGPEKQKLVDLARQLGLSEKIAFLGFQDNPYKYMKQAAVFVLSSLQEGFGNVIVEAMACAAPVVATDCQSGPAEIIQDGVNGLLVPVQDPEALAGAIMKVLHSPGLAKQLSTEGIKRAEFFSVAKSVHEYEKVFTSLVNR